MAIRFQCSKCRRRLKIADHLAGKHVRCPDCREPSLVPSPSIIQSGAGDLLETEKLEEVADASFAFSSKRSVNDELDMTPMVDVTFLLLIFFMITAAFALQKSIEVPASDDQEAAQTQTIDDFEEDSVIIRVDSDNVYWISSPSWSEEKEASSKQDMLVRLREARKGSPDGRSPGPSKLVVMASGDATHDYVVAALDGGSSVGMEEVKLSTFEDEE